jgi:hypothetical protein
VQELRSFVSSCQEEEEEEEELAVHCRCESTERSCKIRHILRKRSLISPYLDDEVVPPPTGRQN